MKLFVLALLSCMILAQPSYAQVGSSSATEILTEAYAKASKENKNVFVIFHASWCIWCHKMDSSMNAPGLKKSFDDNYITIHFTVDESKDKKDLENPGAIELRAKYHGNNVGLPFFLVFDKNGRLLGDSKIRPAGTSLDVDGDNMGCPASQTEVAAFIVLLKKTSSIANDQLELIAKRFRKNE